MEHQIKKPLKYQSIATILAFSVIPISGLATDIYLPSMPQMALELGQPESRIQLTISLFLVSYGVAQFFAGAVVDSFGRYRVSLVSLLLFVFSFWLTAHTDNMMVIYLMRILQGIISGFAVVSKRAFFVDVYEGDQRKHYLSSMTIVWSLAPIIAPFIGGYLQEAFGWQASFVVLSGYCAVIFVLELIFSEETLLSRKAFNGAFLLKEFKEKLSTADFFYGLLMCGISYGTVMFYNLSGPFIIEHVFHKSAIVTGYVSLCMGFAWMCGGFLGRALIMRPFLPKIRFANFLQLFLVAGMIAVSFYVSNLWLLAIFAFLIHLTAGFIFNNYFAYCVGRFPNSAGLAGGITGGVAFMLTAALSYGVAAVLKPGSQLMVAWGYLVISLLALAVLMVVKARKSHV